MVTFAAWLQLSTWLATPTVVVLSQGDTITLARGDVAMVLGWLTLVIGALASVIGRFFWHLLKNDERKTEALSKSVETMQEFVRDTQRWHVEHDRKLGEILEHTRHAGGKR